MPDSVVSGDRCYYCGMEVWQEYGDPMVADGSWLGEDDLSYRCPVGVRPHSVRRYEKEEG